MNKIFFGLMFIFLYFYIDINLSYFTASASFRINLIPDFIGYILLYFGIKELMKYSKIFKTIVPVSIIMMIVSIIIGFMGFAIGEKIVLILNMILSALLVYSLYQIITCIKDIEKKEERAFGSKLLYNGWKLFSLSLLCGYIVPIIMQQFDKNVLIAAIATSVIIIQILFLIVFYRTKHLFESFH